MSMVFGPLVRMVMLLLAASIVTQAGLLVFTVYTLEITFTQKFHVGLLSAVAFGAIGACWILLRSSLAFLKLAPMKIRGTLLDEAENREAFQFVSGIAHQLNAERPDHIVVGVNPNFFVTTSPIQLTGGIGVLNGRTLFMSLGLMRLFDKNELAAVIGHELGHFRGEDVTYSMKFAPTYTRLGNALHALSQPTSVSAALGRIPALVALSMCLTEFATAVRTVGRQRELIADQAGADLSGSRALAMALIKVSLYAPQWNSITHSLDVMADEEVFPDLSRTYGNGCKRVRDALDWQSVKEELGKSSQAHPVDTHPPLSQRLLNLSVSMDDVSIDQCGVPENAAITLLPSADAIEEALWRQ